MAVLTTLLFNDLSLGGHPYLGRYAAMPLALQLWMVIGEKFNAPGFVL